MAFLGFHRRGRGEHERERSERDWGGERKTLDWGERRYFGGERERERFGRDRDIGDYYGPERYGAGSERYGEGAERYSYGAGPERYSSNRLERPEEFGQNRGDWRSDWRASERGSGERDYGRQSWNDRWQESYGPRAGGMSGRGQSGYRGSMGEGYGYSEGSREPTQGAYWTPERTSFSDFGRGGEMSSYGAGQFRGRGPKGYRRSDERVREDVCECLTEDDRVDATNIEVQVKDCEVTLMGTVNSREEKRRAEDLIDDLPGVRDVTNNLRVVNEGGLIEGSQTRQSTGTTPGQTGSTQQGPRH
jgi:osmotically-inducible protein OsmY